MEYKPKNYTISHSSSIACYSLHLEIRCDLCISQSTAGGERVDLGLKVGNQGTGRRAKL